MILNDTPLKGPREKFVKMNVLRWLENAVLRLVLQKEYVLPSNFW